jgi:O-antigen/teichoic acid export membrane protein
MVNILLNQFFNPVVIAARGIAAQVNGAVLSFSQNFNTAMRPRIIKSYAADQRDAMFALVFCGAKGTFFLMYVFTLPLALEMPFILSLWLKNPPEYTVLFTRLTLIDALIDSVSYPIMTAAQATGRIKLYQLAVGGMLLLNLPVSWVLLLFGAPAYSVMIAAVCLTLAVFIVRLVILKRLVAFSPMRFIKEVFIPVCLTASASLVLPALIFGFIESGFLRSIIVISISILSCCGCIYCIGLYGAEKRQGKKLIASKLHK